jgi:hypothetical protein
MAGCLIRIVSLHLCVETASITCCAACATLRVSEVVALVAIYIRVMVFVHQPVYIQCILIWSMHMMCQNMLGVHSIDVPTNSIILLLYILTQT